VAFTVPVVNNSHLIGVAAADPSNDIPHSTTLAVFVAEPFNFNYKSIFMDVPVVTAA
jgi:hypothetical protein